MATKRTFVTHEFEGGWSTELGQTLRVGVGEDGKVGLTHLVNAENIVYEATGGPHKMPGTTRLNSSALESGAAVVGCYDFWRQGTGGSPTQRRVIHVGTTIKNDAADGVFADLFTGMEAGKIPSYSTFDDFLIISSDSTIDVPKSWDGSTAQNLGGSPPRFAFSATHKNRSWAAGDILNPSRLYFCALLDPEDWTGSGSGNIDIDPNDGDAITGIVSHNNDLWVFKGPHKGSIHRITGSAPTGADGFARTTFIRGIGAVGHNSIFAFANDIGFMWSDGSIHSLSATDAFGDYNETALSRPIQSFLRERLVFNRIKQVWAENSSSESFVLFTVTVDSGSTNNYILLMDYRFQPVRWASWPVLGVASIAHMIDSASSNRPILMAGSLDGFVLKLLQADRSINGTGAIAFRVTAPFLDYGNPITLKIPSIGSLGIAPKNDGNITFGWTRDNNAQQTVTITQGGGDVLGPASANQFTLGTSTLSGGRFVDRFVDLIEGGEFRAIQYDITNSVLNEDVEIHSIGSAINIGAWSIET